MSAAFAERTMALSKTAAVQLQSRGAAMSAVFADIMKKVKEL